MGLRFDFWSVSLAQNLKSAIEGRDELTPGFMGKEYLDSALSFKENIIRFDISMEYTLVL